LRRITWTASIAGFFVLAFVCWLSGLPMDQCAIKALVGAAGLYVVLTVATRLVVSIMVSAVVQSSLETKSKGSAGSERRNK
jgi:hypothetical protein